MSRSKILFSVILSFEILAGTIGTANSAFADLKELLFRRAQIKANASHGGFLALSSEDSDFAASQELSFDQKLDHSSAKDMRTFKQRYWYNNSYATKADAPVIYYICGEAACSDAELSQSVLADAQKLGAYAIALEHRYYGTSQPFPVLTTANMKYLTIDNALADLANFEEFAKAKYGLKGKWVSAGGSYPGALSAFYRAKYPQEISGALASSAPVKAQENFEDYDRHVFEVAGLPCATVMRQVVKAAEDALSDTAKLAAMKHLFAADLVKDPGDFLYLLADVGASAVQYGFHDQFCSALTGASDTVDHATQAYGQFAQQIFKMWGVDAVGFSNQAAENTDPNAFIDGVGTRQWYYQSCTEFGFFQNAYHDPAYSVRSAQINPAYHRALCKRLFGINKPVDVAGTNAKFYAAVQSTASNILLTNGSDDPWSLLGINPELGNDTNPKLTAILIQGTAHCADLRGPQSSDSAPLAAAKQKFLDLASIWVQ